MKRAAGADWPRVLNPAQGWAPLASERRTDERVLFVSLQDANEPMAPMVRALARGCGACQAIDWREGVPPDVQARVLAAAHEQRPTIVLLRLQRGGSPITPAFVRELRAHCDPRVVIAHWNGDQYQAAGTLSAAWMVELGREVDTTLLVNVQEQGELAHAGVRHPGFLASGYDPECYRPVTSSMPVRREVVCLANRHKPVAEYARRNELLARFAAWGDQCVLHGKGWDKESVRARPFVPRTEEAAVYSGAAAALSISMHAGVARYTSDRLWRLLGCGAVALVEQFYGWNTFGLCDGVNCLVWTGWEQLRHLLAWVLSPEGVRAAPAMRAAALELAQHHTWEARALELLACVDAVRAARAAA